MFRTLGTILIVLGILAMLYDGISYATEEKLATQVPPEVTAEKKKETPLSPVLGGLMLVGGVALMIADSRRSKKG